jgi:hypothetical protein
MYKSIKAIQQCISILAMIVLITAISSIAYCTEAHPSKVDSLDFSSAKIVIPQHLSKTEHAAIQLLVDEIYKRTRIQLPVTTNWPSASTPVIAVGVASQLRNDRGSLDRSLFSSSIKGHAEGFTIKMVKGKREAPTVLILGNDKRGMLFGAGYFLRKAVMIPVRGNSDGRLLVPSSLPVATYPKIPLRGHQLGYRPKTNTNDGMTGKMWESYIRDLIVFGTNAIELMPPHTDDIP